MKIENPQPRHLPDLRLLWKEAFGDSDAFLDAFFSTGFSSQRCLCLLEEDRPVAVVYWFLEHCQGKPVAYLYAIATRQDRRGQGLCRKLLEQTHILLTQAGYAAAILVPATAELAQMYRKMGYRFMAGVTDLPVCAAAPAVQLRRVDGKTYHRLRQIYLPAGSVSLDETCLSFLESQYQLYAGESFLLAAIRETDCLVGIELLGDAAAGPGILRTLEMEVGTFRTPGREKTFAMYHPLNPDFSEPTYFGLAFQ